MYCVFPSASFIYDGLYRWMRFVSEACRAVEVCEIYCGMFLYHIGLFPLSYNKETSGYDNAEFCYKKSDPLMACTGMFHYYFGSIFWKIHLCIFCRPLVSSVQWTCNGLAGSELVCVGIFCCRDILLCIIQMFS